MWKNYFSPSRRGSVSVWCVFCSRAAPSTKWLPVSFMAGVTASQLCLVQRGVNEGVVVGGRLEAFGQHGWKLGSWREKAPSQAHMKRSTSGLWGGQSYQRSVLSPPSWVATGPSLWGLSSSSYLLKQAAKVFLGIILVARTSKIGDSPYLFLEKMNIWDVKTRWSLSRPLTLLSLDNTTSHHTWGEKKLSHWLKLNIYTYIWYCGRLRYGPYSQKNYSPWRNTQVNQWLHCDEFDLWKSLKQGTVKNMPGDS